MNDGTDDGTDEVSPAYRCGHCGAPRPLDVHHDEWDCIAALKARIARLSASEAQAQAVAADERAVAEAWRLKAHEHFTAWREACAERDALRLQVDAYQTVVGVPTEEQDCRAALHAEIARVTALAEFYKETVKELTEQRDTAIQAIGRLEGVQDAE